MGQRFLQMKHQNDKLQRLLDKTSDREKHAQRAPVSETPLRETSCS